MTQDPPAPVRAPTLADRLATAHRRRFVGRQEEKALLQRALGSAEPPFALLHIHGPGGVGKTTLLRELSGVARTGGATPILLDARDIDPSPEGFLQALELALGPSEHGSPGSPVEALHRLERAVLMIDTFEALTPLDAWLRESFLPQLPATVFVVLAGRRPPSSGWRNDPGWRELLHPWSLRNLRPEESRDYLRRRGVPAAHHQAMLTYTHGHPLALSLLADVVEGQEASPSEGADLGRDPDVVRTLLERFVAQTPSVSHRRALEVCALVRVTTESLLADALELEDAHALFAWLRGLSFIESGPLGLFPHDLARDALDADLRWRNPDRYAELHKRVRGYYTRKLMETTGTVQQRLLFDDVYLHRHNPMVKPFLEWGEVGSVFGEPAAPGDHPALLAMIETHEGEASAAIARRWLASQPEGVTVYRDAGRAPAGVLVKLALHRATPADLAADPAARAVLDYARRYGPPRAGEELTLFRFWMARTTYQGVGAAQSIIFLHAVQHYFSNPRLAWTFFPCADPDFWLPAFGYMDMHRAPEADFEVAGRRYGVFAHDWRAMPVTDWLELLGERELATELKPEELAQGPAPFVVLSEPEFKAAVRDALRNVTRPAALEVSPLLRSRLLSDRGETTATALRAALTEAAETLRENPKDEKSYRAVLRTYLEPADTQELAADLLGLPFSTYRRHLTRGIAMITEHLWRRELNGGMS